MKTNTAFIVTILGLILLLGCFGSDNGSGPKNVPGKQFEATAHCTGDCFEDLGDLLFYIIEIGKRVNNVSYNEAVGSLVYNRLSQEFSFDLDLDDDAWYETVVSGVVRSSYDISDGIQGGEAAAIYWSMRLKATGDTTGLGGWGFSQFQQTYDAFRVTIVDSNETNPRNPRIMTQESCELEITSFGAHIDDLMAVDPDSVWGYFFTGVIEFITHADEGDLQGMIVLDGSNEVTVSVNYLGEQRTFTLNLETYEVSF